MSDRKDDPAFPTHEVWDDDKPEIGWISGGLSKRELIAAMAMTGMVNLPGRFGRVFEGLSQEESNQDNAAQMAVWSCRFADALLAELEKKP